MLFYVYVYHDPTTGVPFYVGKGSDDRYSHHADNARYYRTEDKFPRGYNRHLHYKICQLRSLGLEPVIHIWHRDLSEKQALLLEKIFIKLLGRDDLGTGSLLNLTGGGEGVSGRPPWNKGMVPSVEIVAQISKTLLARYFECPVSEATRDAISERVLAWTSSEEGQRVIKARVDAQVGRKHTDDAKQRISSSKKGHEVSIETRQKISDSNKGKTLGVSRGPMSKETRLKQSVAHLGMTQSEDTRYKRSVSVKAAWAAKRAHQAEENVNV